MRIPLGWQTDLAVLRLGGSAIEDRGDHLVVRTPANPAFYWGNFLLALTDPDDAERWTRTFTDALPDSRHRAIGLAEEPSPSSGWAEAGYEIEHDDALAGSIPLEQRPLPEGYVVRELTSDADWAASTELCIGEHPDEEEYERSATLARRAMVGTGTTAWFGAFAADGTLASELGIVDVGDRVARYQSVLTAADHRRRGLTGHLLGVAAGWAARRGCTRAVLVAFTDGDAGRLYRSAGFSLADRGWRAIRRPG